MASCGIFSRSCPRAKSANSSRYGTTTAAILRELSRDRTSLVAERSRLKNRIQKNLEDANIKLGSVASDILGKSGRAMRWKHYGAESVAYIVSVCNNSCSESILLMSRLQSWKPKSKNRMPPWKKPSLC